MCEDRRPELQRAVVADHCGTGKGLRLARMSAVEVSVEAKCERAARIHTERFMCCPLLQSGLLICICGGASEEKDRRQS